MMSRRQLLEAGALVGVGLLTWGCGDNYSPGSPDGGGSPDDSDAQPPDNLLPVDPSATVAEGLLAPEDSGTLDAAALASLWQLFAEIGRRWESGAMSTITSEAALGDILALKTMETPSYYTEYRLAHGVLVHLTGEYGADQALDMMFAFPADAAADTVAGHIRTYTLAELLRLQVAYGGFRRFGFTNYPGFAGGPLDTPDALPYQTWEG